MKTTIERLGSFTRDQVLHGRSLDYMRWVSCLIESGGEPARTALRFVEKWPPSMSAEIVQRVAIAPGTPSDLTWGGPAVRAETAIGGIS
jgi:hypothetical protein